MNEKILLVEDQDNIRLLNQKILEKENYTVVTAANGIEALKALQMHDDIILILLDIMMPNMNGIEFLEKAKSLINEQGIKVCMLSAKGEKTDIKTLIELGANDYLVKPIEREILLEKVGIITRHQNKSQFFTAKADYPAQLLSKSGVGDVTITSISEFELSFESEITVNDGDIVILIADDLFKYLGLEFPAIFSVHHVESLGKKKKYKTSYVGLSDKTYKSIRSLTTKGVSFEK